MKNRTARLGLRQEGVSEMEYIVTEDSLTVYWERTKEMATGESFRVFLDGKEAARTEKTHCTLSGLFPEQVYTVRAAGAFWESEELSVRTLKKKRRIDITKHPYEAVGDGEKINTESIQKAIDDCGEGEAVYIPEGIFMTGALRLHSDMELYLEKGAVLQGMAEVSDYQPKIKSRFEGIEMDCYSSVLNLGFLDAGEDFGCKNVVIRGHGTVASGGQLLAQRVIAAESAELAKELEQHPELVAECEKPETIPGRVRPRLVNISRCENILLEGITFQNGASWNVHMIYSRHIITHDCTFISQEVWNGDGWDPDSSEDCTIFDCRFFTGDDGIAVKSGKNPEGNRIAVPCRKIRIFDCKSAFGHGITIGSEMSGGVEDVAIWDCDLSRSIYGMEIKGTWKRGGYVKDIRMDNCVIPRLLFHEVDYNNDGEPAEDIPFFSDCEFNRLHILGEYYSRQREWTPCDAIELCGFDSPGHEVSNIRLKDVVIGREGSGAKRSLTLNRCKGICIENLTVL